MDNLVAFYEIEFINEGSNPKKTVYNNIHQIALTPSYINLRQSYVHAMCDYAITIYHKDYDYFIIRKQEGYVDG